MKCNIPLQNRTWKCISKFDYLSLRLKMKVSQTVKGIKMIGEVKKMGGQVLILCSLTSLPPIVKREHMLETLSSHTLSKTHSLTNKTIK